MYVLGLKIFFIYVAILEDRGDDVVFSKGKNFLKHVTTRKVKHIRVRMKNIYKLEVYFSMHVAIPTGVRWDDVDP